MEHRLIGEVPLLYLIYFRLTLIVNNYRKQSLDLTRFVFVKTNTSYYRPQAKVMFSQVFICPQGGSLSRWGLCLVGASVQGGFCPEGSSVQGGWVFLCPGGSLSGGLCPGVSVRGVSVWVRILLECILVQYKFKTKSGGNIKMWRIIEKGNLFCQGFCQ